MTKAQIIAKLKADYPTLTKSFDGVESEMTADEYQAQIETWAEIEIAKQADAAIEAQKAADKQAILDRIGITADEAKLLLA